MAPAFSSTKQAAGFAILLLVLFLLPAVMGPALLPPREEIYSSIWWMSGPYPYIDQQIFAEKGDIDIAFVGSSHMWNAIDVPYVQQELTEKLGRPAVVRSICWTAAGDEPLDFIVRDLLDHRKVHLLVFTDTYSPQDPHIESRRLFRFGDNASSIKGLPLRYQAIYYFAAIIGLPRNLLGLVRSNLPADLSTARKNYWEKLLNAGNVAEHLGALSAKTGFSATDKTSDHAPFVSFTPDPATAMTRAVAYSDATKDAFAFGNLIPSWQLHFVQEFAAVAKEHQSQLVLLHLPLIDERRDSLIHEPEFWPGVLPADVTVVGIPSARLFEGMSDDDVRKLFYNPTHLNQNGQVYFTRVVTPKLLEMYDARPNP